MPKSSQTKLDYMAEYQKSPEEVAKRVARNKARRHAEAAGKVTKGDGKEVHHVKALRDGGSTSDSNTKVVPASKNRAWRKGQK